MKTGSSLLYPYLKIEIPLVNLNLKFAEYVIGDRREGIKFQNFHGKLKSRLKGGH